VGRRMMDTERSRASDLKETIPEAWIGREVMLETTEALSSDLRAAAPVYLEDVNDRGIVMLVTRHKDQSQVSRYFYPWSVVGWIRLAEEDERDGREDRTRAPIRMDVSRDASREASRGASNERGG
jgi:hypothetical protein